MTKDAHGRWNRRRTGTVALAAMLGGGLLTSCNGEATPAEEGVAKVQGRLDGLHPVGAIRDPMDMMNNMRATMPPPAGGMPSGIDLTSELPPPGDQMSMGSCVAWAVGYATKSFQERTEEGWSLTPAYHRFSPSWIYNQIDGGVDQGAPVSAAMELLKVKGVDNLEAFPYVDGDFVTQPDLASVERASRFPERSWNTITTSTTQFKNALAGHNAVVISMEVFPDFDTLNTTTNTVYDSSAGSSRGRHAVAIIGFDDSRSAFKFINSWGTSFASGGYGWIGYSFITDSKLALDAYVMNDGSNQIPSSVSATVGAGGNTRVAELSTAGAPVGFQENRTAGNWTSPSFLPVPSGMSKFSSVATAVGSGGTVQVLGVGKDDDLAYLAAWQDTGNGWHGGFILPGQTTRFSMLAAAQGAGALQVLGLGASDKYAYLAAWQTPNDGAWHTGMSLPGQTVAFSALTVGIGVTRIQVLGLGASDKQAYLAAWQDTDGVWKPGFKLPDQSGTVTLLTTGVSSNGLLQVLGLKSDGLPKLVSWQSSDGLWHGGFDLPAGSPALTTLVAGTGNANQLQVVGLKASDGHPQLAGWQDTNGNWHAGSSLPSVNARLADIAFARDGSGNLQLVGTDVDHRSYVVSWQDTVGNWHAGQAL
jgi:Papain family cysteine protease